MDAGVVDAGLTDIDAGFDAGALPTAVIDVAHVDGQPYTGGQPVVIEALEDMHLDAANSSPGAGAAAIQSYSWVLDRPAASTADLNPVGGFNPPEIHVALEGDEGQGADVVGDYVARLTVVDDQGVSSPQASMNVRVDAPDGLYVEVTWDHPTSNVNMLLRRDDATWCSGASCQPASCREGNGDPPDWDNSGGKTPGDPTYLVEDQNGRGPEVIWLPDPVDGVAYGVAIHAWGGGAFPATNVNVRAFVDGTEVMTVTHELTTTDVGLEVGTITLNGGTADVVLVGTTFPGCM